MAEEKKGFIKEFGEFVARGNVMNMAVGVIIGGAFSNITKSLTDDIISPILGLFGGANFDQYVLPLSGDAVISYGKFITAVINFLVMAFVVFWLVKTVNRIVDKATPKKPEAPAAPTTKICPFCKSEIALEATRCPHCTSEIPKMRPESEA
ncbi:large conductance mechanosensitive channel protein MscL [[Clostridium] aminophilum]|uniref:large conductance mechanosensitive channel protein MscL n=1 Tax=[Clostridium] aminophilum TaxID=1526 RepID=UPI0026F339D5|nr:large conductance mechanosensitive channel protein MscL [[Clostridium] aminophilum]MDD6197416.1 large conductance mechanosensitive channel protein MscL [[Clostridium] aminophilum]